MSVAHRETLGMGIFTLFFLAVLVLAVLYKRRTGERHEWFFPSIFAVALGVVLIVITASGTVIPGW